MKYWKFYACFSGIRIKATKFYCRLPGWKTYRMSHAKTPSDGRMNSQEGKPGEKYISGNYYNSINVKINLK
ncbi:hypothetical protein SAMN05216524_106302 [Mucilaginibacter sp. OK098]|nr:hypothetical protein SAMN05216524_106302 [Mucilaginibacter sp. OK098]